MRTYEGFISDTCSSGKQTRTVSCVRSDGLTAPATACPTNEKPTDTQDCRKTTGCQWYQVGSWSACNTRCGTGTQTRTVVCKTADGTQDALESLCPGPKPPTSQACTDRSGCIKEWNVSAWSDCACPAWAPYDGTRTRTVTCPAGDGTCDDLSKPHASERCACPGTWAWVNVGGCDCSANGQQCPSTGMCKGQRQELQCPPGANCGPRPTEWVRYVDCRCTPPPPPTAVPNAQWTTSAWTRCDCPSNTRTRTLYCPPGYNCGPTPTVSTRETCPDAVRAVDCPVAFLPWQYDQWSACDCRTRKQYRRVYCPEPNRCDPNTKPRDEERDGDCAVKCYVPPAGQWTPTAWSRCDCTTNTQRRTYYCPEGTVCSGPQPLLEERLGECPVVCYVSNNGITNTSDPRCTDPTKKVEPVGDWLMSQWSACKESCATQPGNQTRAVCKTGTGPQPITLRNTLNCIQECASR